MSAVFERLTGLILLDPWLLLLAALLPAAFWLGQRGPLPTILFAPAALLRRRRRPAEAAGKGVVDDPLPRSWRVSLRWLPSVMFLLGLVGVVLALARPALRTQLPLRTMGLDVLLCLDVSSSMTANDLDRSRTRLEVVRDAAAEFIRGRPDDRIGLITFARYPDVRCPLTRDHDALTRILAEVTTVASDSPEDATGIGSAVARAAQVLEGSSAGSRVVILLTDGEENGALAGTRGEIAPVHAAQLCERLGVKVYTIVAGLGRQDASGAWVELDTRAVEHLAKRTGGTFREARDAGTVVSVYAKIDELEKAPFDDPQYVIEDRFLAFLIAALVLLLASRLLLGPLLDVLP